METLKESSGDFFCQKDIDLLRKLADLYAQAKVLILYSEEIDPGARSNIQVIKELRDANDHLMRVLAARLSATPPTGSSEEGYCDKNLDKAIGHVYRAAFDSLDGTVMSLREKIAEVLKSYPLAAIKEVIPNYWELRTKLDVLTKDVAAHRAAKDVAGNVAETLNLYVQDTERIKGFYAQIVEAGPSLDAYLKRHEEEEQQENRRHFKIHTASGLAYKAIAGAFVVIFGLISAYWLGANKGSDSVASERNNPPAAEASETTSSQMKSATSVKPPHNGKGK